METMGGRLGSYELLDKLGEGGMGEVYRAQDARLDRQVAIKILPPAHAADPDRRSRFEREARMLAALNHPCIAQLHGIVDGPGGITALVMELVSGEDLAARLARGPIPPAEAAGIAIHVADALAAAHEQAIIHRDLKPANIKVRDDGTVKVLDFGLAKLTAGNEAASGPANSPTITSPTVPGVIMGTAAYMAPEQATGASVDRRADVWAFGAVLYEMLTGRRAFPGERVPDVLASVLTREPDWSALPAETPPAVRRLLRRCLEKDRRRRLADLSDARLELEEALAAPADAGPGQPRRAVTWRSALLLAAAGLSLGVAGAVAFNAFTRLPPASAVRFVVPLPEGHRLIGQGGTLAFAPDGSEFVYTTLDGVYRRRLDTLEIERVEGIEHVSGAALHVVYSPDGQWLAYWSGRENRIKKLPASGGVPMPLADAPRFRGMSWGADGLLIVRSPGAIERISPDDGRAEVLVEPSAGQIITSPEALPGDRGILFTLADQTDPEGTRRVVVHQPGSAEPRTLVRAGGDARYLPSGDLVYAAGSTLFVVPFDLDRLEVTGPAARIADNVRRSFPVRLANYATSATGALAYVPAGTAEDANFELAFLDRKGGVERLNLPPANYALPRVSPDGKYAAFTRVGGRDAGIWIYELSGRSAPRRLTFDTNSRYPNWWLKDRIVFHSSRDGDEALFWQPADGTAPAERLTRPGPGERHFAHSVSPDGRHLLVQVTASGANAGRLYVMSLEDGTLRPFGDVRSAWLAGASFSPDGRWVAYVVKPDLQTPAAVYVQPFPPTGAVHQVPAEGEAYHPMWSRDGQELLFVSGNRLLVSQVSTEGGLSLTPPRQVELYRWAGPPELPRFFDILPAGERFLSVIAADGDASNPAGIHVVLHWRGSAAR